MCPYLASGPAVRAVDANIDSTGSLDLRKFISGSVSIVPELEAGEIPITLPLDFGLE